jgi:hypothetical protein
MKKAMARAARAMMTAMRVAGDEEGEGGRAMVMAMATRVVGEQRQWHQRGQLQRQQGLWENNSNGNKEGDGNGNAMRLACNKKGNGESCKSNRDRYEGSRQATATRAMARVTAMTWMMATARRLMGDKEGKAEGGKGDGDSDEGGRGHGKVRAARQWQQQQGRQASGWQRQQRGWWQQRQGKQARKRAIARAARAMMMAKKRAMVRVFFHTLIFYSYVNPVQSFFLLYLMQKSKSAQFSFHFTAHLLFLEPRSIG